MLSIKPILQYRFISSYIKDFTDYQILHSKILRLKKRKIAKWSHLETLKKRNEIPLLFELLYNFVTYLLSKLCQLPA